MQDVPDFKKLYESEDYLTELIDTASKMEGVVMNSGTHAAGVVITDKPVVEYLPLHRPTGQTDDTPIKAVTQFEMNVVSDDLGLLKVDFLGLATLTIMARACDLIEARHNVHLNLDNIPVDDPATYELLGRGETAGVFQVEGSGMRRWLMQMKPKGLSNVIAMVALFRPGPMDFIPGYIRRMHGEEKVEYRHPTLEPIFRETYGYPVYQEKLMFAVMQLAGYTAPEADELRKAIAKKLKDKLLDHKVKFVKGAQYHGIDEETAGAIFDDWEEFARYGFNKGHAADYGIIAVQTGYLKAHYPVEYMTALMSVSKDETEKVAWYVADCRRMGIQVEPPDVNKSGWDFTIEDHEDGSSAIRFGMGAVKNVSQSAVDAILNVRNRGLFDNLNEFARRVDLRLVGKRSLECLIKVGVLDRFGPRPVLLAALDRILAVSTSHFRASDAGQMSLFGAHTGISDEIVLPNVLAEIDRREILNWERELIGLYVSDHPLSPVMDILDQSVTHFSHQLSEASPNEKVRVAGLITRIRPHQTKTGKHMGFVTIEDLQGVVELVVFPKTWDQVENWLEVDKIILAEGRVDAEGGEPKILVDNMTTELKVSVPLDHALSRQANRLESQRSGKNSFPGAKYPAQVVKTAPVGKVAETARAKSASELAPQPAQKRETFSGQSTTPPPPDTFPPDWEGKIPAIPAKPIEDVFVPEASPPIPTEKPTVTEPPTSAILEALIPEDGGTPDTYVKPTRIELVETSLVAEEINSSPVVEEAVDDQGAGEVSLPAPESPKLADADSPSEVVLEAPFDLPADLPPSVTYLLPPQPASGTDTVRMITVALRSTGDKTRDVLRMRRIHGLVSTYPGNDRFAFLVFERNQGYLVEFPNFTTGWCSELITQLNQLAGAENVRVEVITFH